MAFQSNDSVTQMRSLAKKISFSVTLTPSALNTFTAGGVGAVDLGSAGAIQTGVVGILTDAAGLVASTATKVNFELKDGYARRFVGATAVVTGQTGGAGTVGAAGWSAIADGQITASGHVAFALTMAASVAAAAGTVTVLIEVTYE